MQTLNHAVSGVRDILERVMTSYQEVDARFVPNGGLAKLLQGSEQLQRELEKVSYDEIERMTAQIRHLIEALLTMDYELRRVHGLKVAFDSRHSGPMSGDR